MFGARYFARRYFGTRYFSPGDDAFMPVTPQQWRTDLSKLLGDYEWVVTSGAGNVGGTTFPATSRNGYADNLYRSVWALSQTLGEYRLVSGFTGVNPATFTVTPAFSAQIQSGATLELHIYRPDYYAEAARRAVRMCQKFLFQPKMDASLTLSEDDFSYALPGGVTPERVVQVQMEGAGPFAGMPYHPLEDVTYSPDGSYLWLNRQNQHRLGSPVLGGRKLYIFYQKPLTAPPTNPTFGTLVNDTTNYIELDPTSHQYELLLLYGVAAMHQVLSEQPANQNQEKHRAAYHAAFQEAEARRAEWSTPPMESTYWS